MVMFTRDPFYSHGFTNFYGIPSVFLTSVDFRAWVCDNNPMFYVDAQLLIQVVIMMLVSLSSVGKRGPR